MRTQRLVFWIVSLLIVAFNPSRVLSSNVGIVYGRGGSQVPPPKKVVDFLTKKMNYKIPMIKIPEPDIETLEALSGTNLRVSVGVPDDAIESLAKRPKAAEKWVQDYIVKYTKKGVKFSHIYVTDDSIYDDSNAPRVQEAIVNLHNSIKTKPSLNGISVTIALTGEALAVSNPPSKAHFDTKSAPILNNLTTYLYSIGSPLIVTLLPFTALVNAKPSDNITSNYALFNSKTPIKDGKLEYYNLFDAMVDAFLTSAEKTTGKNDMKIVVEVGWPTGGHFVFEKYAKAEYAQIFNSKLKEHIAKDVGTPMRKHMKLETYLNEMFDEDLAFADVGQNYGIFKPDFQGKYPLWS